MNDDAWRAPTAAPGLAWMLQELEAVRRTLFRLTIAGTSETEPEHSLLEPLSDDERWLVDLLASLRAAVIAYPAEARSVVSFFVAEGRRYALTDEGGDRYRALVASPQLARLRSLWEATSLNLLDDQGDPDDIPAAWTDIVRDLLAGAGIDRILAALRPEGLA